MEACGGWYSRHGPSCVHVGGDTLVLGFETGHVETWHVGSEGGERIGWWWAHVGAVEAAAVSECGRVLLTVAEDARAFSARGNFLYALPAAFARCVWLGGGAVAWSDDCTLHVGAAWAWRPSPRAFADTGGTHALGMPRASSARAEENPFTGLCASADYPSWEGVGGEGEGASGGGDVLDEDDSMCGEEAGSSLSPLLEYSQREAGNAFSHYTKGEAECGRRGATTIAMGGARWQTPIVHVRRCWRARSTRHTRGLVLATAGLSLIAASVMFVLPRDAWGALWWALKWALLPVIGACVCLAVYLLAMYIARDGRRARLRRSQQREEAGVHIVDLSSVV
eukprot:TRINITY_DN2014_c0_g2_i1.p1 TRINITY_DN2014_c0_g2~~TRINITY_DN2014_c0_g2_i1.p1  ORF type:complete len:338 (-),score=53.68 TRINITY_DN2014_c0_g2_i1:97-1110(-)